MHTNAVHAHACMQMKEACIPPVKESASVGSGVQLVAACHL